MKSFCVKKDMLALVTALLYFSFAGVAQANKNIVIENRGIANYTDKVLAVSWQIVLAKYPAVDTSDLKIVDAVTKKEISYQLEYMGNTAVQNLLVQVSIRAKASISLLLQKARPALFAVKTFGRYVPERKGDFAWENDKIAFRMYGKELEKTPAENAYGMDVWVKRTSRMILNERYKRGEYHIDHGDGMDYYHVGFSLGAGNCMPFSNDSIWYSKNYTQWKVLDNGPLRITFQLSYDPWNVDGKQVTAIKTITLDAGCQLNKVSVQYNYAGAGNLPLVIGIIKRPEGGVELLNEQKGILAYWEPQHGADGTTGVGCIIPAPIKNMQVNKNQLLAVSEVEKNGAFVYYTGAVWNKAGSIKNEQEWFSYLQQLQQGLGSEAIVIK